MTKINTRNKTMYQVATVGTHQLSSPKNKFLHSKRTILNFINQMSSKGDHHVLPPIPSKFLTLPLDKTLWCNGDQQQIQEAAKTYYLKEPICRETHFPLNAIKSISNFINKVKETALALSTLALKSSHQIKWLEAMTYKLMKYLYKKDRRGIKPTIIGHNHRIHLKMIKEEIAGLTCMFDQI